MSTTIFQLRKIIFRAIIGGMKLLSAEDAAARLGVSSRRVRQLIEAGKLEAHHVGGGYVIEERALSTVQVYGKPGRPPKQAAKKRGKK